MDRLADDPILTQAEAARRLGLSRGRVHNLIEAGTLPGTPLKFGVRRSDLEAFAAKVRPSGRTPRAVRSVEHSQTRPQNT